MLPSHITKLINLFSQLSGYRRFVKFIGHQIQIGCIDSALHSHKNMSLNMGSTVTSSSQPTHKRRLDKN